MEGASHRVIGNGNGVIDDIDGVSDPDRCITEVIKRYPDANGAMMFPNSGSCFARFDITGYMPNNHATTCKFIGETCKVTLWSKDGCEGKSFEISDDSIEGKKNPFKWNRNWGAYSLRVGAGCVRVKVWDDDDGSWGAHPQNKFYPYEEAIVFPIIIYHLRTR